MQVGELTARLSLNLHDFQSGLRQAQQNFQQTANRLNRAAGQMRDIGGRMSAAFTAPIAGAMVAVTEGTREFRMEIAKLETNAQQAGADMKVMHDSMRELNAVTGETDSNVEGLSNLLAAGFKGDQFRSMMEELAGASIKFKDTLKFEGVADGLQETLATGEAIGPFAELLDRLGVNLDDFNAGLKEAKKNGEEQNYALKTLQQQGLSSVYEQYKKNNAEIIESKQAHYDMQTALADLGKTLEPVMTQIIGHITKLVEWFNDLSPTGKKVALTIAGIAVVVGPLLVPLGSLVSMVATLAPVFAAAGAAIAAIGGPVTIAIGVIGALGLAAKVLYDHWDEIKEKLIALWEGIKKAASDIWNGIKKDLTETWDTIKKTVEDVWTAITDFLRENGKKILLIAVGPAGWAVLLGTELAKNWDAIKQKASNVWNAIKSLLSTIWNSIKTTIINIANNIKSNIAASWDNMKSTVIQKTQELKANAVAKLEELWDYIKGIPAKAVTWGTDIVEGLWNGISNLGSWLYDKVSDFITDNIIGTVKSVLGIASPSQVMHEFGENTTQGMINGIRAKKEELKAAGIEIKESVLESIASLPEDLSDIGAQAGEGLANSISAATEKANEIMDNWHETLQERIRSGYYGVPLDEWEESQRSSGGGGGGSYDDDDDNDSVDDATGRVRTPEESGLDNSTIGDDGLTDYTRDVRDELESGGATHLAAGGIVPGGKPKPFIIGDAPYAEAVLPLPKLLPMMTEALIGASKKLQPTNFASGQLHIHVENRGTVVGRGGMEEFADTIGKHLGRKLGLSVGGSW
ncbi:MAG: hypothetical protein FH756_01525 [Firmicutes bacterium]|nr:hypothetical protein [Bacillota bacterium]